MIDQVELNGLRNVATALAQALVDTKRYQLRELGASAVVGGQEFRVVVWDRSGDGALRVQIRSLEDETPNELVFAGTLAEMGADA